MTTDLGSHETCPVCEIGSLHRKVEDVTFTYNNNHFLLPKDTSFDCSVCGEGFFDIETEERFEVLFAEIKRNSGNHSLKKD